jgi:hypothetical protein
MRRAGTILRCVLVVASLAFLYSVTWGIASALAFAGGWAILSLTGPCPLGRASPLLLYLLLASYPIWGVVVGRAARQALGNARWAGAVVGVVHVAMQLSIWPPPSVQRGAAAVLLLAAFLGCTAGGMLGPKPGGPKPRAAHQEIA